MPEAKPARVRAEARGLPGVCMAARIERIARERVAVGCLHVGKGSGSGGGFDGDFFPPPGGGNEKGTGAPKDGGALNSVVLHSLFGSSTKHTQVSAPPEAGDLGTDGDSSERENHLSDSPALGLVDQRTHGDDVT